MNKKVVVGMSGGVDSAVSALLLKEQGYEIIALFMKNWEEKDGSGMCQSTQDFEDVARVCGLLDIPYHTINFVQEYWDSVFGNFLEELKCGYTPNPDILCNREIKFKHFFNKTLSLGADFLATGHYAQINGARLLKGADPNKDQSYFIYTLKKEKLPKILFPIGGLKKSEVRAIARAHGLPVSDKRDSTGICFIGKRDFKEFISHYIPFHKGIIEDVDGKVLGEHDGVAYYTLGQRKGLGIGGPGDAWFVTAKDPERNVITLAQGDDHPSLYRQEIEATDLSWVGEPPSELPYACRAKIRYRQADQPCFITHIENDFLRVRFVTPQRAVTPRQSIVFYQGEECLGGGLIKA